MGAGRIAKKLADIVRIRCPDEAEYQIIADVWSTSFLSIGLAGGLGASQAELHKELRTRLDDDANCSDLYVAETEGVIVGMLALRPDESKMDQLFVLPEYQRQGVGQKLLNFAKQKLPTGMWLKVDKLNEKAICFYETQGFVLEKPNVRSRRGGDDVYYRWEP